MFEINIFTCTFRFCYWRCSLYNLLYIMLIYMYNPRKAHIFPHNDCENSLWDSDSERPGDGNSMPRAIRRSIVCREFTAITNLKASFLLLSPYIGNLKQYQWFKYPSPPSWTSSTAKVYYNSKEVSVQKYSFEY